MAKRIFDLFLSSLGILILMPIGIVLWVLCSFDTGSNGFFCQTRIGQHGRPFTIYKFRTMHGRTHLISKWGRWIRKKKIDELPQLINILLGQMSFVGPRPDLPGYYDNLQGEDRKILLLKPGLTSEASLKYADEDATLLQQENPLHYNDRVIFPDKVQLNLEYYHNRSFISDLSIIIRTIFTL